jgi:threonine/homoserine/homoserine lactone efflux protein
LENLKMSIFIKSLIIGLSIAAPVGPIGLLCVQRSLIGGWRIGFATGLGAATADGIYGLIGALGVSVFIASLTETRPWLSLLGGLFLCYLGIKAAFSVPSSGDTTGKKTSAVRSYSSTLLLTMSNPMTVLSFIAIFAALGAGIKPADGYGAILLVVSGVFIGSAAWWLALSGSVSLIRKRISEKLMRVINHLSGAVVLGFGVYQSYLGATLLT